MIAPFIRRLRTWLNDAQANRLRAQLAEAQDRNRELEQRVADLQAANEGAYHELAIERGIACLRTGCSVCSTVQKAAA